MDEGDPRQLIIKIAEVLKSLKVRYIITGGIAVLIWGRPRFTADIDIVVELHSQKELEELAGSLMKIGAANYTDSEAVREPIAGRSFNFIHGETGLKVDFFIAKRDEFSQSRLKRRVAKKILERTVYFVSAEDLILIKLFWHKEAQTVKHLEDVESIFKISGKKLDLKYLKIWAEKLGVREYLDKFLNGKKLAKSENF